MCGFVPLRNGAADDPRRTAALTTDEAVTVRLNQEHSVDPAGLVGVLARPRYEAWTGVLFGPGTSLEWMYLWLACTLDTGVCSMSIDQKATEAGLVTPMFRSSTMAVPGEEEIAYLTWRVADRADDGKTVEIGVVGHSDKGAGLCDRVAAEIAFWNQHYRHRSADFGIASIGANDRTTGAFFLERPHHRGLAVTWR
jgi:protein-L-isoaspartate(D-aspartate) O-methyltransferase